MHDSTDKKPLVPLVVVIAVLEQFGILWLFRAADISERPNPYATDIVSRLGPMHVLMYMNTAINVVLACALYVFSKRLLADAWDRAFWAGIAMALSPWTTWLLGASEDIVPSKLRLLVPGQVFLLVGIIAPYAVIAARLWQLRNRVT